MGDPTKTYEVVVFSARGVTETAVKIHAGSCSFTVSGDLVFEDETRNFQECFARTRWLEVRELKESN